MGTLSRSMSGGWGYWLKRAVLMLLVAGVFVVGMSLSQGCTNNECQDARDTLNENWKTYFANTSASWVPPAKTMEELVDEADVIVIGTLDCVVGVGNQSPYEADKTCTGEFDYPPPHPAHPHVDYLINVERVILDDGTMSGGKTLLMRVGGRWQAMNSNPAFEGMPAPGERRLFALARQLDGKIHVLRTLWNQYVVDGERVTYFDKLRSPACLDGRVKPEDFIETLEDAAARKNET